MGTSYVEYKSFGFWSRDAYLDSWMTALIEEVEKSVSEPWQRALAEHWRTQLQIDGGCISLDLYEFLSDAARRDLVRGLAEKAINRTAGPAKRTGELFVALLSGTLRTDTSSPIDYL
jgi:hypothetical protein